MPNGDMMGPPGQAGPPAGPPPGPGATGGGVGELSQMGGPGPGGPSPTGGPGVGGIPEAKQEQAVQMFMQGFQMCGQAVQTDPTTYWMIGELDKLAQRIADHYGQGEMFKLEKKRLSMAQAGGAGMGAPPGQPMGAQGGPPSPGGAPVGGKPT